MTTSRTIERFRQFPGWELVEKGVADVSAGRVTPHAALVWIAWPRLSQAGLVDDRLAGRRMVEPEMQLYRMLRREGGNAYGRYNGLLRRLVRFEHALDRVRASR